MAEYEEQSGPSAPQGGDGTSGSSVGSASPDIFHAARKIIPPSNIPVKSGVSSQPAVQPHRSSPSINTNSVRSSPALYNDTSSDARGERRHGPPPQRTRPAFHSDKSKERAVNNNDKVSAFPPILRAQVDKAPVLNNAVIDNRHSVEVTEHDLNAGKYITCKNTYSGSGRAVKYSHQVNYQNDHS